MCASRSEEEELETLDRRRRFETWLLNKKRESSEELRQSKEKQVDQRKQTRVTGMICAGVSTPAIIASCVSIYLLVQEPNLFDGGRNGYDASNSLHVVSVVAARLVYSAVIGTAISFYLQQDVTHSGLQQRMVEVSSIAVLFFLSVLIVCNTSQPWAMKIVLYTSLASGSATLLGFGGTLLIPLALGLRGQKVHVDSSADRVVCENASIIYSPFNQTRESHSQW